MKSQKDKDGHILKCSIQFEQELFQLIYIYAPTKSSIRNNFYNNLQNFLEHDKKAILAGDFDMIENVFLDRLGGNPNNIQQLVYNP